MPYWLRCAMVCLLLVPTARKSVAEEVFSNEQKTAIESILHDYYLNHPEAFIEAIRKAQSVLRAGGDSTARASVAQRRNDLVADPQTPVGGNTSGNVTIVEFFDYRCPYCKRAHPDILGLIREDREVRIVYKDLPVLGPDSVFAARAALAASLQGGYQRLHDAMLESSTPLTNEAVLALADASGLDRQRLARDMTSPEVEGILARNAELAHSLGINGTPSFVVGDTLVPGAIEPAGMKKLVLSQREAMRGEAKSMQPSTREMAH